MPSEQALGVLSDTRQELARIERRVAEVEGLLLGADASSRTAAFNLGDLRTELAQLESQATQLEGGRVDAVYTSELSSGKEVAKEEKKSQLSRLEALFKRFERVFAAIKEAMDSGACSPPVPQPSGRATPVPGPATAAPGTETAHPAGPQQPPFDQGPVGLSATPPVPPVQPPEFGAAPGPPAAGTDLSPPPNSQAELGAIEKRLFELETLFSGPRGPYLQRHNLLELRQELGQLELLSGRWAQQLSQSGAAARRHEGGSGSGRAMQAHMDHMKAEWQVQRLRTLVMYVDGALGSLDR